MNTLGRWQSFSRQQKGRWLYFIGLACSVLWIPLAWWWASGAGWLAAVCFVPTLFMSGIGVFLGKLLWQSSDRDLQIRWPFKILLWGLGATCLILIGYALGVLVKK